MKTCSYCGAEYPDDAVECAIDGTPFSPPSVPSMPPAAPAPTAVPRPEFQFAPLSPADEQKDFVTLLTCGTLVAADLVVARLRAAGIEAFLPDECLMQAIGWNLNTYGFVRVQVTPKDYATAQELLGGQ